MRFVPVVFVVDIAVLQHIQEFSLGDVQVRPCRVCADDLFHTLTYQKSASRSVVMPIVMEQCADNGMIVAIPLRVLTFKNFNGIRVAFSKII